MTESNENWAMYVPDAYRAPEPELIIAAFPFGQIITTCNGAPYATSVPMYLERTTHGELQLVGHMARKNPHAATLETGQLTLATFHGPNAYISASWYKERPTVPTWNYLAAQVRGVLETIDGDEEQLDIMRLTIERSEVSSETPWVLEHAPDGKVESLLPYIRSFRITVTHIDAVTKLSQTQPKSDQKRVVQALETRGTVQDIEIAKRMRNIW